MKKEQGFTVVESLLVLLVVAVVGFAGYYVYSQQSDSSPNDAASQAGITDSNRSEQALVDTEFMDFEGDQLSISHPGSWEVSEYQHDIYGDGTLFRAAVSVKSDAGNYLHLWSPDGLGGACEPNTVSYSLVKRLVTQTEGVIFSEYSIKGNDGALRIENQEYASSQHKALKEGESSTDTCSNDVGGYSSLSTSTYVNISKSSKPGVKSEISYQDIASDTGFIEMLTSLNRK